MERKIFFKKFLTNFTFLKVGFALLTVYLIVEEFIVFLYEKPTYSSDSKTELGAMFYNYFYIHYMYKSILGPEDFPSITICADPGFDHEGLKSVGYWNSHEYSEGFIAGSMDLR